MPSILQRGDSSWPIAKPPTRKRPPSSRAIRCCGRSVEGGWGEFIWPGSTPLGREVCVKVLAIPEGVDAETCRERFRREAELLAMVSHPHILTVLDFGITADDGVPYLVTEYIEGGDLARADEGWAAARRVPGPDDRLADRRGPHLPAAPRGSSIAT